MSQILRAMKTELMQISRFYGSQRNMRSHYDTLRIPQDASQRDIRLAFVKLSKEMHPDLTKKTNHMDFVRVNEAYKVLSKKHTRERYDMDLKCNDGSNGRPVRIVYYKSEPNPHAAPNVNDHNDPAFSYYYGIKGLKRVSNVTFAFLCLLFSAFGVSIQVLLISKSMAFKRDQLLAESQKFQDSYNNLRTEVSSLNKDQQIASFEQRAAANETADHTIKFQS